MTSSTPTTGSSFSASSSSSSSAGILHWPQRHFMLFAENQTTTQLQSLRSAIQSYLRTSDYEVVTQVLQLQLTLLTLQYQTVSQSMTACATRNSSSATTTASMMSSSSSRSGSSSGLSVAAAMSGNGSFDLWWATTVAVVAVLAVSTDKGQAVSH